MSKIERTSGTYQMPVQVKADISKLLMHVEYTLERAVEKAILNKGQSFYDENREWESDDSLVFEYRQEGTWLKEAVSGTLEEPPETELRLEPDANNMKETDFLEQLPEWLIPFVDIQVAVKEDKIEFEED